MSFPHLHKARIAFASLASVGLTLLCIAMVVHFATVSVSAGGSYAEAVWAAWLYAPVSEAYLAVAITGYTLFRVFSLALLIAYSSDLRNAGMLGCGITMYVSSQFLVPDWFVWSLMVEYCEFPIAEWSVWIQLIFHLGAFIAFVTGLFLLKSDRSKKLEIWGKVSVTFGLFLLILFFPVLALSTTVKYDPTKVGIVYQPGSSWYSYVQIVDLYQSELAIAMLVASFVLVGLGAFLILRAMQETSSQTDSDFKISEPAITV